MTWFFFLITVLAPGHYQVEAYRMPTQEKCLTAARAVNAQESSRTAVCEPRIDG